MAKPLRLGIRDDGKNMIAKPGDMFALMRRLSLYAFVAAMLAVHLPPACADSNFAGDWYSIDLFTGGIPLLNVYGAGTNLTIHGWGACTPTDCNWGTTPLAVLHDPTGKTNDVATAVFDFGFEVDTLTLTPLGNNLQALDSGSPGVETLSRTPPIHIYNLQTNLAIIWPFEATNFTLQVTSNLAGPGQWTPATNSVSVRSIEDVRPEIKFRVYAIAIDSFKPGTTFYRLVH